MHELEYRYSGLNLQVWENCLLIMRTNLLADCRFLWPTVSVGEDTVLGEGAYMYMFKTDLAYSYHQLQTYQSLASWQHPP